MKEDTEAAKVPRVNILWRALYWWIIFFHLSSSRAVLKLSCRPRTVHAATQSLWEDTEYSCFKTTLWDLNTHVLQPSSYQQSTWMNTVFDVMPQCNVTYWRSLEWAMPWLVKFMFKEGADCSENIVLSCSRCRYLLIFTSGDFYFVVDGIFQKRWEKILRKITKYLLTLLHLVCHRWLTLDVVYRSYFL